MLDQNGNPERMMEGHESVICMLAQIDSKTIVSGSWDGTAKVWDLESGKCTATLEGHSHAVAVFVAPDGRIITGSQDKKIRIWNSDYTLYKEWDAHMDIVRKFADFSPIGFVSCSNDGNLKIWTYEGDLVQELKGHSGYVFTVYTLPGNIIVSGGDDRMVKIWKD
jgi:phospholipase A-2-activating protein